MKVTFTKEEVETIVKDHVSKLLPDIVEGKELSISGSGYSNWDVDIIEKEPEDKIDV